MSDAARGAQMVGHRATVKLCRVEEYLVDVYLPEKAQAERIASLHVGPNAQPDEYDVVHSEIIDADPVYEDDVDAHEVASWLEAPTAPSEETYYDDTRHFGGDDE